MSDQTPILPSDVTLSALKASVDVSKVFLTFLSAGGNRFKTAAACGLSVEQVDDLARSEGWAAKLAQRSKIASDESKTGEALNREIQRLQANAQAQRLLGEIDRVLLHLAKLSDEELLRYTQEVKKDGTKAPTAAFFVEMAKAMQTCHLCVFRATGDQLPARPEAPDEEATMKGLALSLGAEISKLAAQGQKDA